MTTGLPPTQFPAQLRFLSLCASGSLGIDEACQQLYIQPATFNRWLNERHFRSRFNRIVNAARKRRDATLILASAAAAEKLARAISSEKGLDASQQRACFELIKLARELNRKRAPTNSPPLFSDAVDKRDQADLVERLTRSPKGGDA